MDGRRSAAAGPCRAPLPAAWCSPQPGGIAPGPGLRQRGKRSRALHAHQPWPEPGGSSGASLFWEQTEESFESERKGGWKCTLWEHTVNFLQQNPEGAPYDSSEKKDFKIAVASKCTNDACVACQVICVCTYIYRCICIHAAHTHICVHMLKTSSLLPALNGGQTQFDSSFCFSSKKFATVCKVVCEAFSLLALCASLLSLWELVQDIIWRFLWQIVPAGTSSSPCREVPD